MAVADLGTKWEQDWQYQPNAATMYVRQGSIVTALQSKPLSITATCFQYHEYGRRTGLKIRSSQEGVGSSPTFGISDSRRIAPCLIARPSSKFTNATNRPVSMLTTHTARQHYSNSLSVIGMPLKTVLFRAHGHSGRQSREIGMKSQDSELSRQRQR